MLRLYLLFILLVVALGDFQYDDDYSGDSDYGGEPQYGEPVIENGGYDEDESDEGIGDVSGVVPGVYVNNEEPEVGYEDDRENGGDKFFGLYNQYSSRYSKYFYNYCTKYIQTHPSGEFVDIAQQYVTTYKDKRYGSRSGSGSAAVRVGLHFYKLYNQYHSGYSRYFYSYCTKYLHSHPSGQYAYLAQKYLKRYKFQYTGSGAVAVVASFSSLYKKYSSRYSKYFFDYCTKYAQAHPHGKYTVYAQQYLTRYKGYGGSSVYGARSGNFLLLYKKYHYTYNKSFFSYCKKYLQNHPHGQYVGYVRKYLAKYKGVYSGLSVITNDVGYNYKFYNFYNQYSSGYNKRFYSYCTKYIHNHPHGQYVKYAKLYLAKYKTRFSGTPSGASVGGFHNFYKLYNRYNSNYSKYFYNYCSKYVHARPNGSYIWYARQYLSRYQFRFNHPETVVRNDPYVKFFSLYSKYKSGFDKFFYNYCKKYIKGYPHGRYVVIAQRYVSRYNLQARVLRTSRVQVPHASVRVRAPAQARHVKVHVRTSRVHRVHRVHGVRVHAVPHPRVKPIVKVPRIPHAKLAPRPIPRIPHVKPTHIHPARVVARLQARLHPKSIPHIKSRVARVQAHLHPKSVPHIKSRVSRLQARRHPKSIPHIKSRVALLQARLHPKSVPHSHGATTSLSTRSRGFYSLYSKYSSRYSKKFYEYCSRYGKVHPKGRYIAYARGYITRFKRQYTSASGSVSNNFYSNYHRYGSSYHKKFYKYCKNYIQKHPSGKYVMYAWLYLSTYKNRYIASW